MDDELSTARFLRSTASARSRGGSEGPTQQRLSGPAELVQAIPYLLGFRPGGSLVVIGLDRGVLSLTARLDLVDVVTGLPETLDTMVGAGVGTVVLAIWDDGVAGTLARRSGGGGLPWADLMAHAAEIVLAHGCLPLDLLLVSGSRWWAYCSLLGGCPPGCPGDGGEIPAAPSAFVAAATVAGVVALPSRAALADQLAPVSGDDESLLDALGREETALLDAELAGHADRAQRRAKRAVFAAARASDDPDRHPLDDAEVARLGVALGQSAIRDPVWLAVDAGRLDGRVLWRDLATRLPAPWDAPALLLFGWRAWRHGDGALAAIAAERALASDSALYAATLLQAAVGQGLDPRRAPRLRPRRTA